MLKLKKQNIDKCIAIFLFISSYFFYYLSLEPCLDGEEICGNKMKWIYKKIAQIIISCEIISYLIIKYFFIIYLNYICFIFY